MSGRPLYLALSGGGAHAAVHAGVLRALEREGVAVAGIAGVSGGALVAAAWAGGADLDQLVEQASRLHPWMWVRGWGGGLLSGTRLGALIDEFLPTDAFEALRVPVVVLATDVDTGEGVVFREGNLRDAVRASCSFPGVFPPFAWNGRRLVDGGVTEVVPVRLAREMAGEQGVVLAIDCNAGGRWPAADSFIAIALRAGLTLVRGRTRSELVGADLVIAPPSASPAGCGRRASRRSPPPAKRPSSRGCPSCGGCSRPDRRRAVRRIVTRLAVLLALVGALVGALAVYDRPPVAPGTWLAAAGLEARHETVDGHRLRYVRAGSGPAVVLVHGFASSLYTWKDVIPALAAGHDVVALDLPGFGQSDQPADLSFEDFPRAVLGLMDRLGIGKAALVGNSMGGATAAIVAAETAGARRPPSC